MELIANEFVRVVRTKDGINYYDLQDKWNGTSGYTKGKRGLDKATTYLASLPSNVKENVTMGEITSFLRAMNLKPRTYCSID
jgi:hypothetical protein